MCVSNRFISNFVILLTAVITHVQVFCYRVTLLQRSGLKPGPARPRETRPDRPKTIGLKCLIGLKCRPARLGRAGIFASVLSVTRQTGQC